MKVFISHSSKDKAMYADYIAEHLEGHCNYDAFSFDAGGKTEEEIKRCIQESELHVVLISKNALISEWVQKELKLIYDKLERSKFDALFPIIIDKDINHTDVRIPNWIRESYNLKPITRPKVALQKIRNKLSALMYAKNPMLGKRKIFAGRNDEMKLIEERMNDLEQENVRCLIVSGIQGSGRKTLIKQAIIKNHIADKFNNPIVVSLNRQMSIEDMIQQCSAFAVEDTNYDLIRLSMEEKIDILSTILIDLQNQKLILIIDDSGCIVNERGEVVYWLIKALNKVKKEFCIGIASQHKVNKFRCKREKYIFSIEISTLSKAERNSLLKASVEAQELNLSQEELLYISGLLTGFPDQVFYAIELFKEIGFEQFKKYTYKVREYSEDKVQTVLNQFAAEEDIKDFLSLLSRFDFISISFVRELTRDYFGIDFLPRLLSINLVERFGAFEEYIKLNETVKDFLQRARFETRIDFVPYIQKQLKAIEKDADYVRELDIDELNLLVRTKFEEGNMVAKFAIPSHYLKTIIDLYNSMKYRDLIQLVDGLKEAHTIENFDERISTQIFDYYCLSLARERNERFWDEVSNIKDKADNYFLQAFAHKKRGNNKKAYEMALKTIKIHPLERAKRLLVDILVQCCAYDEAFIYTKENYDNRPNNPYHIQAYFNCLLRKKNRNNEMVEQLVLQMEKIQSETAKDMFYEMHARYLCEVKNDAAQAICCLQKYMRQKQQKRNKYLSMTLFDLYLKDENLDAMKHLLASAEFENMKSIQDTRNNYYFRKACYEYASGENLLVVKNTIDKMHFISEDYKTQALERVIKKV